MWWDIALQYLSQFLLHSKPLYEAFQLCSAVWWPQLTKDNLVISSCTHKILLWQNQYHAHKSGWSFTTVPKPCCNHKPDWNIPGMTTMSVSPWLCFQPTTNNQRILLERHPEDPVTGLESALSTLTNSTYSSCKPDEKYVICALSEVITYKILYFDWRKSS